MYIYMYIGYVQLLHSLHLTQTLTTLILRENKISEIPAEIGNLTQLTALDISHNNLQGLPEGTYNVGDVKGVG